MLLFKKRNDTDLRLQRAASGCLQNEKFLIRRLISMHTCGLFFSPEFGFFGKRIIRSSINTFEFRLRRYPDLRLDEKKNDDAKNRYKDLFGKFGN